MEVKRIHPLECMRLQGWDLAHWKDHKSPFCQGFGSDDVQKLAGNMWNMFSYARIKIAAVGCVDWELVDELVQSWELEVRR